MSLVQGTSVSCLSYNLPLKYYKSIILLCVVRSVVIVLTTGHYGCGGCIAALGNKKLGLIDNWLRHIRDVKASHAKELDSIPDMPLKADRLVEFKYFLPRMMLMIVSLHKSIQQNVSRQSKKQWHNEDYRSMDGYTMSPTDF